MASSHKGAAGDSVGRNKMSFDQKRQLVYKLSKNSNRAFKKVLQDWTCDEIRQILCAESEKERKYTGLTKDEIINKLFKTVSKKNTRAREVEERNSSLQRQRKDLDPLHDVTQSAKTKETEFGVPLTGLPAEMSRGIVNRLCCPKDVKKNCSSALKLIDGLPLPSKMQRSSKIRFEDVFASSVTLVIGVEESSSRGTTNLYSVWHRKVSEKDYPIGSTCELFSPNTRFVVSDLTPATEYCFKVVCFSGAKELSVNESKVSTQALQEEEVAAAILLDCYTHCNNLSPPRPSLQNEFNSEGKRVNTITDSDVIQIKKNNSCEEKQLVPENLSITHRFRSDELNDRQDRPENANKVENVASFSFGFEHCVKLIRQLECSGLVKSDFRQKFLTWYSLRATAQEKYVVKTFVDTFKEDTAALAEQLIDTFSDCISRKRPVLVVASDKH